MIIVLNAAARLIYHLRLRDHISVELATLHWLCVPERVQYKIAVLTFKVTTARYDIWDRHLLSLTYPVGKLCGQQVPAA